MLSIKKCGKKVKSKQILFTPHNIINMKDNTDEKLRHNNKPIRKGYKIRQKPGRMNRPAMI